jgi:hypothetical protein
MAKFGLSLNEEKTRILEFGRYAAERRARRGQRRPETFDFLGFTHVCAVTRMNPHFTIRRVTIASRMRATLRAIRYGLMKRRHATIANIGAWLRRVVQGYLNHRAIPGNLKRPACFAPRSAGMAALASATQPALSHDLGSVPALRWAIQPESPRLSSASQSTVRVMTQGRSRMR